jgi:hypothetical protein
MNGSAVQQFCQSLLADAGFSFDGGNLQMRSNDLNLADEPACRGADRNEGAPLLHCGEIECTRPRLLRLQKVLSRHTRASLLGRAERLAINLSANERKM